MLEVIPGLDPWDPNNWRPSTHEFRIYADESLDIYAVVDAKWYPHLCKYKWSIHDRRKHLRGFTYLRRTICEFHEPDGEPYVSHFSGKVVRNRKRTVFNRFLHTEVMLLSGKEPPTPDHDEVDHFDRDPLNCREENLEWATRQMQIANSNRWGPAKLANLKLRHRGKTFTSILP